MTTTLVIPGLHSSGSSHWQTWLEQQDPTAIRVHQRDWQDAYLPDWSARVRRQIRSRAGRFILVAHSFGVLAAVQAAADHKDRIAGALLVAPADPDGFAVAEYLPSGHLGFPSVVVASTNDPWMRFERAAHWASVWGSELMSLGASGHINAASGFGPWPGGLAILRQLQVAANATSGVRRHNENAGTPHIGRMSLRRSRTQDVRRATHISLGSHSEPQQHDPYRTSELQTISSWSVHRHYDQTG